jgi:hypothetical protein
VENQPNVVHANELNHQSSQFEKSFIGRRRIVDSLNKLFHEWRKVATHHLHQEILLGGEMLVERGTADPDLGREIGMGHSCVTELADELSRRVEQLIANIVAIGFHGHAEEG